MYVWFQSHLLAAVGGILGNSHTEKTIYLCRRGERSPFSKRERQTNPSDL